MIDHLLKSVRYGHTALAIAVVMAAWAGTARAQSVVDRLSGFDPARLTAVAQWAEQPADESLGQEAAKLLYQVNRLARGGSLTVDSQAAAQAEAAAGQLTSVRGQATQISSWNLPETLADALEFEVLYRVEVTQPGAGQPQVVITSEIPKAWDTASAAESVRETSATGVLLRPAGDMQPAVIAAPGLAWLASLASGVPKDWALLGEHGFDVSLLEGVRRRDRQSLQSQDSAAFYPLLRIAASLENATLSDGTVVAPMPSPAAGLLKDSANMVGRYVRINAQAVRVIRITVTSPDTQRQLGGDHYWQLDAIGDLGNVIIRIESEGAQPAMFENRYPISIAVRELPPFLEKLVSESSGADPVSSDIAMVSREITVDGFFYRLWSYDSDYMAQHGGGSQFGPLIVASRIIDGEPNRGANQSGVSGVGWFMAALAVIAVLAAVVGGAIAMRRDTQVKRRQRAGLPQRLEE